MAYNALNNLIDAYIYANGVQAITGQILNGVLKQMVSQLGSGYHLMGVAGPETVPASNDYAMAYFAATAGEYTDFGGITIAAGEVAVLLTYGNVSWSKQTIYNVPTGTADLENTANFITNAVTDLVNYYTKEEIDTTLANYPTLAALDTALADYYTKAETDTKLGNYYRKAETYDKSEVDSIVATLSRQEYIVAWDGLAAPDVSAIPAGVTVSYSGTTYTGTLDASASTVNKIYMVWNGTAYDMYATSQDGGYSWVPMGTTTMDLSQYATKDELNNIPNLPISPEIIKFEYIDQDGTINANANFKRTDRINVYFIEEIEITAPDGGSSYVCFLDKDMARVLNFRVEQGTNYVPVPDTAFYLICSYGINATDWQFTATKFNGKYKESYAYLGSNIRLSNYENLQITQKYGNGNSYVLVDFGGGYIVFIDENGSSGWVGPLQSYTIPSNGYLYYNIKSKSVSVSQTILPLTENALLLECHYGYAISGVLPAMKYQSSQFSYEYNVRPVLRFAYYESISITRNGEASLTVNFGTGNLLYYFYGGSSLKQYFSLPSTDYVVPHNGYLYYNIANNTIEISNSQRFGYTDILLVNCHRGYPVQGWLTEIYVNTKTAREYSYSGQRVTIGQSNAFAVSKWKDIPFQTIMQGCAIYNNLLFVAGTEESTSKFFIYNVDSGELVAKVANDPSLHYNTMYFSDEFPENGSIPYLYVNEWDGSRRICVYKFANDYTPTLVQTITVSNIDTSIIGSGQMDFGVDLGNKKLYTISYKNDVLETTGNSTIVCEFELPTISETTTINLTNEDVKRTFVLPFIYLRQQCLYENGKIYVLTSENYGYLCVIDVASATITNRIWLGADAKIHALPEVEGLFTYNYNAYVISYGDTGVYRLSF